MSTYNRDQRHLLQSGGWWALYDGFTGAYVIAFALALGASNTIVGLLGALPFIAALFSEIPGAKLLEWLPRLRIYGVASTISRLSWVGVAFAPLLFPSAPLAVVIAFYFLSKFCDYLSDPAWTTLVADLVPTRIRGDFVSRRTRLIGIWGMLSFVIAGVYLDLFGGTLGFQTMFLAGILFGVITTFVTLRVREPAYHDHDHHGFKEFFHVEGDFRRFTIFAFCFNFAFMLASPFFTAYILQNLAQPYIIFALSTALTTLTKIIVYHHVGKLSDKFGDKPILALSILGTALVPLTFLFVTQERIWLLWFAQALSGIVWAGYDVAIFNMFLDLTTPDKRAVQTATYTVITSVPLVIAPILGGFIADNLVVVLSGIPLVFAISMVLRFLSAFMLFGIPERRVKHEYPLSEVFLHAFEMHPSRGIQHRWHGLVRTIKKKGMLLTAILR